MGKGQVYRPWHRGECSQGALFGLLKVMTRPPPSSLTLSPPLSTQSSPLTHHHEDAEHEEALLACLIAGLLNGAAGWEGERWGTYGTNGKTYILTPRNQPIHLRTEHVPHLRDHDVEARNTPHVEGHCRGGGATELAW